MLFTSTVFLAEKGRGELADSGHVTQWQGSLYNSVGGGCRRQELRNTGSDVVQR